MLVRGFLQEEHVMPDTIGIIGMGIMGRPMARNLLKAGFPLVVHNRHPEVTDTFVALGACAANRPCDIAALCDVVITLLPTSADVEQVATGPDGIIEVRMMG
jgi:3-hydroxyisobutyrate dehydrogenase-like beta-hydroxyacid dehydrogenase